MATGPHFPQSVIYYFYVKCYGNCNSLTLSNINLLSGSYHCMRKMPVSIAPHRYLQPLYGLRPTQHLVQPLVSGTLVVSANFRGTNLSGIRFMCIENRWLCLLCRARRSCLQSCGVLPKTHIYFNLYLFSKRISLRSLLVGK